MDQFEVLFEQANEGNDSVSTLLNDVTTLQSETMALSDVISVGATSPYNLVYGSCGTLLVNSTVNPFIVNLPASTGSGWMPKIVNVSALATGLVKLVPATGEKIGPLPADTAAYLQNVDQSGWTFNQQYLGLVDSKIGQWAVSGGQLMPEPGSVDAAGTQYHLGKYIKLPIGNTSLRAVLAFNSPPALATWSSAYQITGQWGVPVGAKSVRLRVDISTSTAQALSNLNVAFSDNTSSIPTYRTTHPVCRNYVQVSTGTCMMGNSSEIDVPLNSSGRFFIYTIGANGGETNYRLDVIVLGYYTGV
jgi:hypothetical protein